MFFLKKKSRPNHLYEWIFSIPAISKVIPYSFNSIFQVKVFNLTHPVSGKLIFTPHYEEEGFEAGGVRVMPSVVLVILILKFHETKLTS